jgi:hypothetical protein
VRREEEEEEGSRAQNTCVWCGVPSEAGNQRKNESGCRERHTHTQRAREREREADDCHSGLTFAVRCCLYAIRRLIAT